ncbi:MAG TPA: PadR family transcriptional regulator [Holophaga sp.]|nr:PadR family transcriptional regulator [Holophaga sp.]
MTATPRHSRHLPAFILLALAHGPLHGNAIRAALTLRMPGFKVDAAAIYRALHALEAAGDVVFHWDTGIPGPARKIYELTPGGWQRLDAWEKDIRMRLEFLQVFLEDLERVRHPAHTP